MRTLLLMLAVAWSTVVLAQAGDAPRPNMPPVVQPAETITLYTGEVKILRLAEIERVAVGNGDLLSVSHLANELVLIGTATGYTNLVVWTTDGRLHAYNIDVAGPREASVEMKRMIYLTVQVVDFRKSVLSRIGINWQQAMAGPVLGVVTNWVNNPYFRIGDLSQGGEDANTLRGPSGVLNTYPTQASPQGFAGITTSLSSVINLAAQNGDAYILASPQLSTRSGGSADFLAGGEVPIPITSALGQVSVQYKEYGIKLTIKPEADRHGQILASIDTEVSQIDPSVTVNSFPGFLTRRASASVNVMSNQTIVLSGLMQANGSENVSEVPWLGKVPILGRLFSSEDYQAARSELVIFVTPTVFDVESQVNQQVIERGLTHIDTFNAGPGREVYAPGFGTGPSAQLPPPPPEEAPVAAAERAAIITEQAVASQAAMPLPSPVPPANDGLVVMPPPAPTFAPIALPLPDQFPAPVVPQPAEPRSEAEARTAEDSGADKMWGVQVSSSSNLQRSRELLQRLQRAGHSGGLQKVRNRDGNDRIFVVRLGPYPDRDQAFRALSEVEPAHPTAYVVQRHALIDPALLADEAPAMLPTSSDAVAVDLP